MEVDLAGIVFNSCERIILQKLSPGIVLGHVSTTVYVAWRDGELITG